MAKKKGGRGFWSRLEKKRGERGETLVARSHCPCGAAPLASRARTSPRRGKRRTTSPSNEDEDFLHFRLRFPTAGLPPRLFASAAADLTTARCSLELAPGER